MAYVHSKAAELKGKPLVGSRQCAALVQKYAGAPATCRGHQAQAVLGNRQLKAAIARMATTRRRGDNADAFFVIE